MHSYELTSETVSHGHPDKLCDQISDALLDELLAHDPEARAGIEVMAAHQNIIIAGEVTSKYQLTDMRIDAIVRNTIAKIGYISGLFNHRSITVTNYISSQSPEIANAVDRDGTNDGAGDQGTVFGYACDETDVFMPAPLFYANKILQTVFSQVALGNMPLLGPDAKCQLTLRYDATHRPIGAQDIVFSIQHPEGITTHELTTLLKPLLFAALPEGWISSNTQVHINPSGSFILGGPLADTGLTGRKIIVDSYGAGIPHGGGAFSGKDPSKLDRSGAYMARYLAKNIVASGLARKCLIGLSYAIGVPEPTSIFLDTFATSKIAPLTLIEIIKSKVSLTSSGIRSTLALHNPIYSITAAYGHFGRATKNPKEFTWERLDLIEKLSS